MSMSKQRDTLRENPTFVGKLCETKARRDLVDYFIELYHNSSENDVRLNSKNSSTLSDRSENESEVERMTKELMEDLDYTRHTINENIPYLVEFGLVEKRGEDRYIRYSPCVDSPTFQAVVALDELIREATDGDGGLTDLYGGESRGLLVDFFIRLGAEWEESGDEHDPLTKTDIHEKCGVSRKLVIDEIDTLVEYDIVAVNDEYSYHRYIPQSDSDPFDAIIETNIELAEYYNEQQQ